MKILSIFKGGGLKPLWRFKTISPSEIIWKLLISPEGILAGEERDTELKTASLFALEVISGKILWRGAKIDEVWWFNSERATLENIFIQKFRKPDMPEPKGIVAVDISIGKLRWEQPDVSMLFEYEKKVYAQREAMGRKEFFAIDSISGEVLEAYGSERENILSMQSMVADTDIHSVFSIAITPEDELFSAIGNVLNDILSVEELRGTIDFAEYGKYIIFSYHERKLSNAQSMLGNMLRNHLKVLDTERGEIIYSDEPNSETPYPVPENFFINRGVLIYVKEKTEIIGVNLGE
ncbi:MAG: DUF4905 domain-containing protein [bacterium]